MKKILLLIVLVLFVSFNSACSALWEVPEQGTVEVQTINKKVTKVVRAPGIWTTFTLYDDYYPVSLKTRTEDYVISSATSDNARFKWTIGLTFSIPDNDDIIKNHVERFGVEQSYRDKEMLRQVGNALQNQVKISTSTYGAYDLLLNQSKIQTSLVPEMNEFFKNKVFMNLEQLVFKGQPDFENDDIDKAGERVVVNQKAKEAEQEGLAADKIKQQRQQIQAEIFANPSLLQIEKLKLEVEREKARSEGTKGHQGPLTVVYGDGGPQLQLKNQ